LPLYACERVRLRSALSHAIFPSGVNHSRFLRAFSVKLQSILDEGVASQEGVLPRARRLAMPSADNNSPSVSLDACSAARIQCVLSSAVPFIPLDPLTPAHLSGVSYLILGLYAASGVLLYTAARSGRPLLIFSEHRQPQSQRTVHKQLFKDSEREVKASKEPFACETDAHRTLSTCAHGLRPRSYHNTVCSTPRCGRQGRLSQNTLPAQVGSYVEGALALRVTNHPVLIAQQIGCILTINELADTRLPHQGLLAGYTGHVHAEYGFRVLKDPRFWAALPYLKTPEQVLALPMVMTAYLPASEALKYRLREALEGSCASAKRFYHGIFTRMKEAVRNVGY
jgi:hypothetical protein